VNRLNGDSLFAAMGRSNNFPSDCADHTLTWLHSGAGGVVRTFGRRKKDSARGDQAGS